MKKIVVVILLFAIAGCKKFVEVDSPSTSIVGNAVFRADATAISAVTDIYSEMSSARLTDGISSLSLYPGLSADELRVADGIDNIILSNYYKNSLVPSLGYSPSDFWFNFYTVIYRTNAAIEGLNASTSLNTRVKRQLLGEVLFMRAFCYFYLVNLYGDVPLAITPDYTVNAMLGRNTSTQVYDQILKDLQEASGLLSEQYLDGTLLNTSPERVRPVKGAALALLARTYLYLGRYADAEAKASDLIADNSHYSIVSLENVFFKNNNEAIWQLQPVNAGYNTMEAQYFVLPNSGPSISFPVYMSPLLVSSFEAGDRRKNRWVDSVKVSGSTYYYSGKYKSAALNAPVTEYSTVLRLGEMYLIRAEARVYQNKMADAVADLNVIRNRARSTGSTDLPDLSTGLSKDEVIAAVMQERRVELFTEWGHRWLDLQRTGVINSVMSEVAITKGSTWSPNWSLYPIPLVDLQRAPNLRGKQNPGYTQ